MAKEYYVYSTLSTATTYTAWTAGGSDVPRIKEHVTINGKAGIADKHLITPRGTVTKITEQQLKILNGDSVFKLHRENGFITVETADGTIDAVVANMTGREPAAPLVPGDFKELSTEQSRAGAEVGMPETTPGGKGGANAKK